MALGKEMGEFSLNSTGVSFGSEGTTTAVNYEGTATGYGTVAGTLTFHVSAPGATSGTCAWVGAGFLDNGEVVNGTAHGVWERLEGQHRWRVRSVNLVSDGTFFATDGEVDLESRSYNGKLLEWS